MLLRERGAEFVDGSQFALGHLFHQRINLERSRDDESAFAELFRELAIAAVAVLRQILGILEFSIPIDPPALDCHSPNSVSEAAGIAISI